jgi:methionyl-tRNA formyltransferase
MWMQIVDGGTPAHSENNIGEIAMGDHRMRVVFMGTSAFSLKALVRLYQQQINSEELEIIAVYTQAPKPSGRNYKTKKSVVHEFAETNNIPVHTPKSLRNDEQLGIFRALRPDVAVVAAYGLIIPQNILDIPRYGFINIHASILPRWRGAAPIQAAIMAGDKKTGISIMKMNAGVDTGDVISTKQIDIHTKSTHGDLEEQLGNLGAEMIVDTFGNLEKNLNNTRKQPEEGSTYAQKISKEACKINWEDAANSILKKIMSLSPVPSAWTEIDGLRIKILDADVVENHGECVEAAGKIMKN